MTGVEDDVLATTGYTTNYILQKLHQNCPKYMQQLNENRVVKITADDISQGKGYCSKVFKVTIYFDRHDNYTFIIKIPTDERFYEMSLDCTEAEIKQNKEMVCEMHNIECDSYDLIKDLKDFPTPKIFYLERPSTENSGVIIMEDLSQSGACLGLFFSITQQHCFNLARHIADFQIYVDFLPTELWKDKFTTNIYTKSNSENDFWKKKMENNTELSKICEFFIEIDTIKLGTYSIEERARKIGCTTLVHGDMWTNNMLIKVNDDKSISNEILAIIDWQTTFQGNPLFDIARFITNCADAEVRRECEYNLVNFYFDYLTKKYEDRGEKMKFTREEAIELYDLALLHQTFLCLIMYFIMANPLSENSADRARAKKMALRLNLLFEDALVIMDKYGLKDMFRL